MIKRPNTHIKETRSLSYVQNVWAEWAVNKLDEDYGVDLEVTIFENNEVTDINFPAQLKSTDKINIKNDLISFSIDTKHLNYFFNHPRPFVFILFDNQNGTAYWLIIQDYVWDILNEKIANWFNQKYNTIYLPIENKIEDKTKVKEAVMNSGKRIIQENWYKLRVGEGLGLNNTLNDIEKLEKFEEETELKAKETKFIIFNKLIYQNNIEEANNKLLDIYNQNKRDLMHLRSIIGITSLLSIADPVQNGIILKLCLEGIEIAKELKNEIAEALLVSLKNNSIHFLLIEKAGKLLYSRNISLESRSSQYNLVFLNKQFEELTKMLLNLNEETNEVLDNLIKNKDYYFLIYCLAGILSVSAVAIQKYKTFDPENEFIDQEISNKMKLSNDLIKLVKIFNDDELELTVKSSVAWLYFYSEKPESLNLMQEALDIAIKIDNKSQIERLKVLVKIIEENPNPFDNSKNSIDLETLTTSESQELLKKSLEYQGIDLSLKDSTTEAILLGLKDANPEKYFKYCKNIYIAYISTSPLGQSIGLPFLGSKMIYCPYAEYSESVNLELLFEWLVSDHCKNCDKREPRDPDWECKVKWVEEMRNSDVVRDVLREIYGNRN